MRESGIVSAASLSVEANLLGLLLECFTDDGHFQAGLSYVDRALKDLNARDGGEDDSKAAEKVLRRVMLEGRVKFLSRLGRSSGAGLKVEGDAAAKGSGAELLLAMWGRTSVDTLETFGEASLVEEWFALCR